MEPLPDSKRPRIEEYYGNQNRISANSAITLHFVVGKSVIFTSHPQFTHQVFGEKEEICTSATRELFKIDIYVNVSDLSQVVHVLCPKEETDQLSAKLIPRVPANSVIDFIHTNDDRFGDISTIVDTFRNNAELNLPTIPLISVPLGQNLGSFEADSGEVFEFYLSSHKVAGTSALVSNAEKLAVWYIETADGVSFEDDKWEVLLCYKREGQVNSGADDTSSEFNYSVRNHQYSLAGYMTLYSFSNPFAGSKLRICQALVLPSMQRRGLGHQMMICLYRYIAQSRQQVVEITVEDPCEGFSALRDLVDTKWCITHMDELMTAFQTSSLGELTPQEKGQLPSRNTKLYSFLQYVHHHHVSGGFTKNLCTKFASILRVTLAQFRFSMDALCLLFIRQQGHLLKGNSDSDASVPIADRNDVSSDKENSSSAASSATMKNFRIQMKRSLLKENPELKLLPDKEQVQKELLILYNEEYQRALKVVENSIITRLFE